MGRAEEGQGAACKISMDCHPPAGEEVLRFISPAPGVGVRPVRSTFGGIGYE